MLIVREWNSPAERFHRSNPVEPALELLEN
ncbi:hypothetical protein J2S74_002493 [Evansella vedderi]|uniref:Uncharacterized protein n=1 Tax=Evansella vedderi TaxID=38282 RepID=A0ABT9ZV40_9BACI|nr:hypothetical protein [Evansella vedderi]